MTMVNLAKTAEEMKADRADLPVSIPGGKISGPEYPYGCCISLDDETLTKLSLDGDLPAAGEMVHFEAMGKVTCASVRDEIQGDGTTRQCRRVEIQITNMGMIGAEPAPRAKKRYVGGEPDGDEG